MSDSQPVPLTSVSDQYSQISATFHYQKVKNTKFNEFFRCMAYLGFNSTKLCKRRFFYLYQIYSLQLETLEAYKIIIFRFTSLKFGSFNLKLYVDFLIGLNLENPITQECVDPYSPFFLRHLVLGQTMVVRVPL